MSEAGVVQLLTVDYGLDEAGHVPNPADEVLRKTSFY